MQKRTESRSNRVLRPLIVVSCATVLAGGFGYRQLGWHKRKSPAERFVTTGVRRADLFPTLTAMGRVESSKRTVITCELEDIAVGVRGQRLEAGGASVLLSVIP